MIPCLPSRHAIMVLLLQQIVVFCLHAQNDLPQIINARLATQAAAWNRGDIEAFMAVYWKSASLTFSSGETTTTGWQATLDRYKSRYPNRQTMGNLAFEQISIQRLADDAAYVIGMWKLTRQHDQPHGRFTLIFRRLNGEWFVVHDHTSVAEK